MVVLRLPVNTIRPSDLHLWRKIYLPRTVANAKVLCAEEKKYGKKGILKLTKNRLLILERNSRWSLSPEKMLSKQET